jgi:hypothetical protein
MIKLKTHYFFMLLLLLNLSCVGNKKTYSDHEIADAMARSLNVFEDSTKFDKSEFPESSEIPMNTPQNSFSQHELTELSLLINLPNNMYIITRNKYSEGIDKIPWIKTPNKSLKEDFDNNNIYFLGITNNFRLEICKAKNDISKKIGNLKYINNYEMNDITNSLSSRREWRGNSNVSWKFYTVYKSTEEIFLKFGIEEFDETIIETDIYYTIVNGNELILKFYLNKADKNELESIIQMIIDGLSFL